MSRITAVTVVTALAVVLSSSAQAAILYMTPGDPYMQDFNSLPNAPQNVNLGATPIGWKDDDPAPPAGNFSILGWYLYHPTVQGEGGFNGHQRMRIGAGTANTGAFMSFGASGLTDRALGMVSSNTMDVAFTGSFFGARIRNETGRMLASFTLDYKGEQWRDGGATVPNAQSITFDYSLNATTIEDALALFKDVPTLDFTSPTFTNTGSGAGLDGNDASLPLPINKLAIGPVTVTELNWQPGTDLWIRWSDANNSGNDHGLAIDDLNFTANIPEPTSLMLLLLGAIGVAAARRVPRAVI